MVIYAAEMASVIFKIKMVTVYGEILVLIKHGLSDACSPLCPGEFMVSIPFIYECLLTADFGRCD
jgi:hypothetical protein